ncbi:3774_t:CDS:2 [Acaulospora morrowiae]|uniref:3774_t:CDS:1 n=1 Tax=Acaulospora morrowiae TaxID=94023 RepID=A0A9N8YZU0_9GLOM|nr:3774_t:CDS:2 [Acaulospora morrowiae]
MVYTVSGQIKGIESRTSEDILKEIDICINDIKIDEKKELGSGSFGSVYRAEWTDRNLVVAVKCLDHKILRSRYEEFRNMKEFIDELLHEVKMNRRAGLHNNITTFYGISKESQDKYYLVFEYAQGGNLRHYLRNNFSMLNWLMKINIAKQIANGLSHLHSHGIIHKDLHSKNILVNGGQIQISDFGLSKFESSNSISRTPGTHFYTDMTYIDNERPDINKICDDLNNVKMRPVYYVPSIPIITKLSELSDEPLDSYGSGGIVDFHDF